MLDTFSIIAIGLGGVIFYNLAKSPPAPDAHNRLADSREKFSGRYPGTMHAHISLYNRFRNFVNVTEPSNFKTTRTFKQMGANSARRRAPKSLFTINNQKALLTDDGPSLAFSRDVQADKSLNPYFSKPNGPPAKKFIGGKEQPFATRSVQRSLNTVIPGPGYRKQ